MLKCAKCGLAMLAGGGESIAHCCNTVVEIVAGVKPWRDGSGHPDDAENESKVPHHHSVFDPAMTGVTSLSSGGLIYNGNPWGWLPRSF
jgi:hypothetical protein